MQFLALEHETAAASAAQFTDELLRAEARRVHALQQAGVIRAIYFRDDCAEAVLMLECADRDAVQAALDSLPLVQAGLITFDLIGLRPYPGMARLFDGA